MCVYHIIGIMWYENKIPQKQRRTKKRIRVCYTYDEISLTPIF